MERDQAVLQDSTQQMTEPPNTISEAHFLQEVFLVINPSSPLLPEHFIFLALPCLYYTYFILDTQHKEAK